MPIRLIALYLFFMNQTFAGILVYPTRVLLTENVHVSEFSIKNNHEEKKTFEILPIYYIFNEMGGVENEQYAPKVTTNFLGPYIRYSPQSVALAPGEEQKIRIYAQQGIFDKKEEYRAHMLVRELPQKQTKETTSTLNTLTAKLNANISVAIPIIYRKNKQNSIQSELTDFKLSQKENELSIEFQWKKTPNISSFANIKFSQVDKKNVETLLGEKKGVSNYGDLLKVKASFPIHKINKDSTKINIQLYDNEHDIEKSYLLAL